MCKKTVQALVFEEIATMDYPYEGIPTVPPRKDMDHMAFFCGGCRYRVTAYPDWQVSKVSGGWVSAGCAWGPGSAAGGGCWQLACGMGGREGACASARAAMLYACHRCMPAPCQGTHL